MPRVRHDELSGHPDLAVALRWLRHRRRLTQGELRERVGEAGGSVSLIYIQQMEAGRKRPSPPMLDRLLDGLGADRAELAGVIGEVAGASPADRRSGWRPSRRDPARADAGAAVWSDQVELAGTPLLAAVAAPAAAEPALADSEPSIEPMLGELSAIARGLDPQGRRELLAAARGVAASRRR